MKIRTRAKGKFYYEIQTASGDSGAVTRAQAMQFFHNAPHEGTRRVWKINKERRTARLVAERYVPHTE